MATEVNKILAAELKIGETQFNNFINVTFRSSNEDYTRELEDSPDSLAEEELFAFLEHVYASTVQHFDIIPATVDEIEGDTVHFLEPDVIEDFRKICWGGFYAARFWKERLQHQRAGKLSAAKRAVSPNKQSHFEAEARNLQGKIDYQEARQQRLERIGNHVNDIAEKIR